MEEEKKTLFNPYAKALEGLHLDDPVKAFFDFCKERESIRIRREKGEPAPWTQDPVFQKGRFLNVFREDDRGTKALFKFVGPLLESQVHLGEKGAVKLVQALFFARWCNRDHTLNFIDSALLDNPTLMKSVLTDGLDFPPWCNETAYPVEVVTWKGQEYSRIDAATKLFSQISHWLFKVIQSSSRDVVKATKTIAQELGMKNDFPVFMAVMDLAWFRPDLIDPDSVVPTGIGAVAYLDILQKYLGLKSHEETALRMIELQAEHWPEAKRLFKPIDIEYLSCECRKYYSYVNGTKAYEGKNVFKPGKSPMLPFNIPTVSTAQSNVASQVVVIAGGPCSGKTTLIKELKNQGRETVPETAEEVIKSGLEAGLSVEEQRKDPVAWQMDLLKKDFMLFDGLMASGKLVFTDTSFIETVVFGARAGIEMTPEVEKWIKGKRYHKVFFLGTEDDYRSSKVRMETEKVALQISQQVKEAYSRYGYQLVEVPSKMSLDQRIAFILGKL